MYESQKERWILAKCNSGGTIGPGQYVMQMHTQVWTSWLWANELRDATHATSLMPLRRKAVSVFKSTGVPCNCFVPMSRRLALLTRNTCGANVATSIWKAVLLSAQCPVILLSPASSRIACKTSQRLQLHFFRSKNDFDTGNLIHPAVGIDELFFAKLQAPAALVLMREDEAFRSARTVALIQGAYPNAPQSSVRPQLDEAFRQDYGKRGLLRLSLSLPIVRAIAVNRIHVTPCNEHLEPELETTLTSVSGVSYEVRKLTKILRCLQQYVSDARSFLILEEKIKLVPRKVKIIE
ncbi:hypothetical protein e1012e08.tmp0071 [Eimeria tenella]|uniref:Uncharacterized protein n=1 Tax=Eimeria tenella TaxID=5802 RepID=C8TDK2_EIMTE|nr:hypothetical protein e1012e08.tmp0071 [Eimeria tenella]